MMCLICGFVSTVYDFINDYTYNEEAEDEIVSYRCPMCGNENPDLMELKNEISSL